MNDHRSSHFPGQIPHLSMARVLINLGLIFAMLIAASSAHALERFPPDMDQRKPLQSFVYRIFCAKPVATLAKNALADSGRKIRIVAFGDSLTAGYGLNPGQAFPDVLQMALKARGHDVEVINAGVSGDTTAAGLARLDWAVGEDADAVIVELGANDALRGQPPVETRANLDAILRRLDGRNIPVLLAGMRSPENWGSDYRNRFDAIFGDLSAKHGALLYPFFLDGVATDPKLNQPDGLHPNAHGVAIIVERIVPKVEELIGNVQRAATGQDRSVGR